MQKRIYITIDLPDEIKESFRKEEGRWKNLNVFWTGFSHLHLTLEYLGIIDKDGLKVIKQAMDELTDETKAFDIRLDRITLGPNEKEPRFFWARILEDKSINDFRKKFRERCGANGLELKEMDFVPNILLATANGNQLKGKQTNVRLRGRFRVEEMNLYSSHTYAKGTTKYKLLETFQLQK